MEELRKKLQFIKNVDVINDDGNDCLDWLIEELAQLIAPYTAHLRRKYE